jgi:hypothetical protein
MNGHFWGAHLQAHLDFLNQELKGQGCGTLAVYIVTSFQLNLTVQVAQV